MMNFNQTEKNSTTVSQFDFRFYKVTVIQYRRDRPSFFYLSIKMGCRASSALVDYEQDPRDDKIPAASVPNLNTSPQLLSTVLTPKFEEAYYIDQANQYFDTLDTSVEKGNPKYSDKVARWEWPPWLILTGFGQLQIQVIDGAIRESGKCICVDRQHKFFPQNPFVRSVVTFYYGEEDIANKTNPLRIFEEFTFNDAGEITFVEAWWDRDYKDLLPALDDKGWPLDQNAVKRLSTQLPGLGNSDGKIHLMSDEFIEAANKTQIIASFRARALHFGDAVSDVVAKQLIAKGLGKRPKNIPL